MVPEGSSVPYKDGKSKEAVVVVVVGGGGGFLSEILIRDGGMDILVLEPHDKKINDFLVLLQNKCLQCPNPYC